MKKLYILALCLSLWGCHHHKPEGVQLPDVPDPDRVLYDRAMKDLSKDRFTVARLTLQTLINTYPDSEYLPQAKFALADSFYKEGTASSYTQAEAEFRDFITFFPTNDQADDAQYMIAMTHVRQIEQPDRDNSEAKEAEVELRRFLDNYPDSPKLPEVKARLRGVEEVLAQGDYDIGSEYFVRHSYPAAIDRYREVLQKYPDFSETADALFYMAESLRRMNQTKASAIVYAQMLVEHPLSLHEQDAKARLMEMSMPIPEPNPVALARAQQAKPVDTHGLLGKMWELMKPRPDVSGDSLPTASDGDSNKPGTPGTDSDPNSSTPSRGVTPATAPATPGSVVVPSPAKPPGPEQD